MLVLVVKLNYILAVRIRLGRVKTVLEYNLVLDNVDQLALDKNECRANEVNVSVQTEIL